MTRGFLVAGVLALMGCAAVKAPASPVEAVTPASPLGSYLAARHAQEEHDYADAARFMERALQDDPGNFDLVRRTLVLRLSEGRIAEAVPLATRLVELDGNSGLPALTLLVEEIKKGDFDAATKRAQAMPREGAQRFAVPLLLAWSEVARQRPAPALQALDQLSDLKGLEPLRDLHAALIADYADQIDEAQADYAKLLGDGAQPTWRVVEVAGNFFERHSRDEEAKKLYERFAAGDSDSDAAAAGLARIAKGIVPPRVVATPQRGAAEALFDLASVLNQRETADAALLYARLALELDPNFPLAQLLAGEIRDTEHHTDEALALYSAIDPASPLSWTARLRAAAALDGLDRTDEAVAQLQAMAAERPDQSEPLMELGDLLRGHNKFPEAVKAYDAAIARVAKPDAASWRMFYSRGVALERAGDWPRAEADLLHALALQPDQPLVLNYLGYSWIDKGQHLPEALKMIQRAVELRPSDGYIVDSLGWAYYRLGDYGNAAQALEHAVELLPEDPTINDHLGDVYWRSGRVPEARFQWRRALLFKPDADEVKTIETKIDHGLTKPPATVSGG